MRVSGHDVNDTLRQYTQGKPTIKTVVGFFFGLAIDAFSALASFHSYILAFLIKDCFNNIYFY